MSELVAVIESRIDPYLQLSKRDPRGYKGSLDPLFQPKWRKIDLFL